MFSLDQRNPPSNIFEQLFIAARAIDDPKALESDVVRGVLDMFAREGSLPVWVGFRGSKELYYPAYPLSDAIANPTTTPWQSLVGRALIWRKHYGLD
jgi:hypothetical protein